MNNNELSKYSSFRDISTLFGGLGTLLIDGDALIDYIQSKEEISNNTGLDVAELVHLEKRINVFINKLKNCGFKRVEIIFFEWYFTKSILFSRNILESLFKIQNSIFFNCIEDIEWLNYAKNEQICAFLTNVYLNSIKKYDDEFKIFRVANDYVSKIMLNNEISIALLDYIQLTHSSIHTFSIDYRVLLTCDLSLTEYEDLIKTSDLTTLSKNMHFKSYDLENKRLIKVLENQGEKLCVLYENERDFVRKGMNYNSMWEIKNDDKNYLNCENDRERKLRNHQKYYRYMERYSQSLNSSKSFHHKIIIENDENKNKLYYNTKKEKQNQKMSSKAEVIIQENQLMREKKRKTDDLEFIKVLENEIKLLNLEEKTTRIDGLIEKVDENRSILFPFYLRKLKYKLYSEYHKYQENINLKLCILLKEIIETHYEDLIAKGSLNEYLKHLANYGFKETSKFLSIAYLSNFSQTAACDIKAFNNEIYLQLKYNGDKLKRTLNSSFDERVRFKPDKWQVKLLDIIDRNESALVCCPTGCGKTFICYYAMEKILRSNDYNDMIVFISPAKALANQVAAEIYARFGDVKYPNYVNKSIYAMYMPDYYINDPFNCRILITIPTMFETLLCSQINKPFINSIRYVIIDEMQTINYKYLGSSIEKIIHLIDCPILALSATIANIDEFFAWFNSIEKFKSKQSLHKIIHRERYCDLQKFMFIPGDAAAKATELLENLNKEHAEADSLIVKDKLIECFDSRIESLVPVHEMLAYSSSYLKNCDFSFDFHLLPTEIVAIIDALEIISDGQEKQGKLVKSIKPDKFFKTTLINKNDVKNYEKFLVKNFREWILNGIFTSTQIERFYFLLNGKCDAAFKILKKTYGSKFTTDKWILDNIVYLIQSLHERKMLPAIIFSKSYKFCDDLAEKLTQFLEDAQHLEKENERRKIETRKNKKLDKRIKKFSEKQLEALSATDEFSPAEIFEMKDYISEATKKIEIDDKYTFFNPRYKLKLTEIENEIELHKHRNIRKIILNAWKRGIGVHHDNYNIKYRSSTEYLFRKQHLQVVFATETLSLGINMPCKTVVLLNDAANYNTMLYRQMVGRAGRRSFDTIGNIVYFGIPENKIKLFISSDLILLKGMFTFKLENILQSSALNYCDSENIKYLESSIRDPILVMNKTTQKTPANILVKWQIDYLIDNGYLTSSFEPNSISYLILPLRQHDCEIFLIAELIRNKFFNKIFNYQNDAKVLEQNCEQLILVLCYFTKVVRLDPILIKRLPKDVILPKIPKLDEFLKSHNMKLDAYFNWLHSKDISNGINLKEEKEYFGMAFPYYKDSLKNSYIYEFYLNGRISTIEDVNCISVLKLWYSLRTFRILLATLVHYIQNYHFDNKLYM